MSGDEKLRERYVQAYLHDARPMSVILKELGGLEGSGEGVAPG